MQRLKCKNRFAVRAIVGDGQGSSRVAATSCVVRGAARPSKAVAAERKAQPTRVAGRTAHRCGLREQSSVLGIDENVECGEVAGASDCKRCLRVPRCGHNGVMSSADFRAWREALERAESRMEAIEQAAARLNALTAELREVREERRSFECERAARREREIKSDPGRANARMAAEPGGEPAVPPDRERTFMDERGDASRAPKARAAIKRAGMDSGASNDVTLAQSPAGMSSRGIASVERQVAAAGVTVCAVRCPQRGREGGHECTVRRAVTAKRDVTGGKPLGRSGSACGGGRCPEGAERAHCGAQRGMGAALKGP